MNVKDSEGYSALHYAAIRGHPKVCQMLSSTKGVEVDSPKDLNARHSGWLLVMDIQMLCRSLQRSERTLKDNIFCQTPLTHAAQNGHYAVVELLVGKGTIRGFQDTNVKLTLRKGADVNAQVHGTALFLAAKNGHEAVVNLLENHGGTIL